MSQRVGIETRPVHHSVVKPLQRIQSVSDKGWEQDLIALGH